MVDRKKMLQQGLLYIYVFVISPSVRLAKNIAIILPFLTRKDRQTEHTFNLVKLVATRVQCACTVILLISGEPGLVFCVPYIYTPGEYT